MGDISDECSHVIPGKCMKFCVHLETTQIGWMKWKEGSSRFSLPGHQIKTLSVEVWFSWDKLGLHCSERFSKVLGCDSFCGLSNQFRSPRFPKKNTNDQPLRVLWSLMGQGNSFFPSKLCTYPRNKCWTSVQKAQTWHLRCLNTFKSPEQNRPDFSGLWECFTDRHVLLQEPGSLRLHSEMDHRPGEGLPVPRRRRLDRSLSKKRWGHKNCCTFIISVVDLSSVAGKYPQGHFIPTFDHLGPARLCQVLS